ncbi:hypothetical protein V8C37DRAFT_215672 [Trichoderma ceciliae]
MEEDAIRKVRVRDSQGASHSVSWKGRNALGVFFLLGSAQPATDGIWRGDCLVEGRDGSTCHDEISCKFLVEHELYTIYLSTYRW